MSIDGTKKIRGRGRPRVRSVAQHFRIPLDLASRIDAWAATHLDRPPRSEAIRLLVEKGLTGDPVVAHLPDAALDRQIAKAEAAIAEMPRHVEQSLAAGLAAMDKAMAENDLVKLKNKRTRRKIASRK